MTYREYVENHPEENLSWCRPYRSENGRVALSCNEGRIQTVSIDGEEIDIDFSRHDQEPLWERACKAALDEDTLGRYDGYSWREIALSDALVECGCANCPWKDTCDAMSEEIEAPNELNDHPGSIFC